MEPEIGELCGRDHGTERRRCYRPACTYSGGVAEPHRDDNRSWELMPADPLYEPLGLLQRRLSVAD